MAKKQVGIRIDEKVVAEVARHAKEHNSNTSCTIEFILCQFFGIRLETPEQLIAEKDAEIERLKQELEATRRRQKLTNIVPALQTDRFSMENG